MTNSVQFISALHSVYPQVVRTVGDVAYDANGNEVAYDKAKVQAYVDAHAYIAKRAAEYPPITDWLDGMVKGDQEQMDKYVADCLAIKKKYPKGVK
jgi:hypothetical protein